VRKRLRHLPAGLATSGVLLVVGLLLGAGLRGGAGAAGAAAGVGLVATSYTVSSVVVAWADSIDPRLVLPAGVMTYLLKVTAIGAGMWTLASSGWAGLHPMGVAILASTFAWLVAQAVWTWRARIPYVEVD